MLLCMHPILGGKTPKRHGWKHHSDTADQEPGDCKGPRQSIRTLLLAGCYK